MARRQAEGGSEVSVKRAINYGLRYVFATLATAWMYDFFYNPLWLHGYVYAMNTNATMTSKEDESVVAERLQANFPIHQRAAAFFAHVLALHALYSLYIGKRAIGIVKMVLLSAVTGAMIGLLRAYQGNRIMPILHDAFYCYISTLIASLILLIRFK